MRKDLTDQDINESLAFAIPGFDASDKYPEWSNDALRAAYRAGWEDAPY